MRTRSVEKCRRGAAWQPQQVAQAANMVAVEALQLLCERSQVPEGILDARVEVHLHRLNHLPQRQPGREQCRRIMLKLGESWTQLNAPVHMVKSISDPQVIV